MLETQVVVVPGCENGSGNAIFMPGIVGKYTKCDRVDLVMVVESLTENRSCFTKRYSDGQLNIFGSKACFAIKIDSFARVWMCMDDIWSLIQDYFRRSQISVFNDRHTCFTRSFLDFKYTENILSNYETSEYRLLLKPTLCRNKHKTIYKRFKSVHFNIWKHVDLKGNFIPSFF